MDEELNVDEGSNKPDGCPIKPMIDLSRNILEAHKQREDSETEIGHYFEVIEASSPVLEKVTFSAHKSRLWKLLLA